MAKECAKIVLLGEMNVGKSSIAMRLQNDKFNDKYYATIGSTFTTKNIVDGDREYMFHIWDTAGKDRFRALAPLYYRDAAAAVLVFDITCKFSFDCIPYWVSELGKRGPSDIILVLVGNKCDCDDEREIPQRFSKSYAAERDILFFETSAKTGENIREMLVELGRRLPDNLVFTKRGISKRQDDGDESACCCVYL